MESRLSLKLNALQDEEIIRPLPGITGGSKDSSAIQGSVVCSED